MEKVFDLRFIVPPILMLFFVFLFSPSYFLSLTKDYDLTKVFVFGPIVILVFGVMISSVVNLIFIGCLDGRYSNYDGADEKKTLKSFFSKDDDMSPDALEVGSWLVATRVSDYVKDQVDKRWNWANAGFNYCAAMVFSALIVVFGVRAGGLKWDCFWSPFWFLLVVIFFVVFFLNARRNWQSVRNIDKILARNYESLREDGGQPPNKL